MSKNQNRKGSSCKDKKLKKEMISKDAAIQLLKHKCSKQQHSSQAKESKLLKYSKVAMKSCHKSDKLLYNVK